MPNATLLLAALSLSVSTVLGLSGCGNRIAEYCDQLCECQGKACTDATKEACQKQSHDLEEIAHDAECDAEFDALLACINEKAECKKGELDSYKPCRAENQALGKCSGVDTN